MPASLNTSGDDVSISIDGVEALANLFDELARASGRWSLDAAMQEACDTFAGDVLLPEVRQEIPTGSGFLASQLAAFSVAREMPGGCAGVGFPKNEAFQGDTYYAGFLEFGWKAGKRPTSKAGRASDARGEVPADKFLRRTLYANEPRFKRHVQQHLNQWVRRTNRL
jgi:hypothetical protein